MYFNGDKADSYDSLFNFIILARGLGKTYNYTKLVIRRFLKDETNQFIYLRRYKSELKTSAPKFFDAVIANNEFPNVKLEYKQGKFLINGKVAGYSIALSTSNINKSTSYPNVKTIIFDEFMLDKGVYHYLPDEVTLFLNFYETVARLRDDVKVYFLGNAISVTNPYFLYFNLELPYNNDYKLYNDNTILVHYGTNEAYTEAKKESRFGKLISGTEFESHAVDNKFIRDSTVFISKRPPDSKFYFLLVIDNNNFGVWIDYNNEDVYISNKYDPNTLLKLAVNTDSHHDNTLFINYSKNNYFKMLVNHFRISKLFFESQFIKNIVMDFLTKYLTY